MNVHANKPACYLEGGEPPVRAEWAKDQGRYCYQDDMRLTPGCEGCRRLHAPRD